MNFNRDWKKNGEKRDADLADAMDRSDRELKLLANFYHQHGYIDRAQEIYRTMLKIQEERQETSDFDDNLDEDRSA